MVFGIMLCSIVGEILTGLFFGLNSLAETFKSLTLYILVILSFGLGLSSYKFSPRHLVWVLYIAVMLNLLFIFYKSSLPSFLIDLYYPPLVLESWIDYGITDVNALLELARPRGLFPNPNVSAFMVNIISLFIYISIKNRLLTPPKPILSIGIVLLPIIVSVLLASRGEMIVSTILAIVNYRVLFKEISVAKKFYSIIVAFFVIFSIGLYSLKHFDENGSITTSFDRILTMFEVLNQQDTGSYESRNQGASRPLLLFETVRDRFIYSPFFGSGYSGNNAYPFDHPTQYYHNDWFRLLITSGLIGVVLMVIILRKFCFRFGYITLLPFLLPGLVNSFLLNIPAVMFYFYMIGFLNNKNNERSLI